MRDFKQAVATVLPVLGVYLFGRLTEAPWPLVAVVAMGALVALTHSNKVNRIKAENREALRLAEMREPDERYEARLAELYETSEECSKCGGTFHAYELYPDEHGDDFCPVCAPDEITDWLTPKGSN